MNAADTLVLGFRPPELQGNNFLLFQAPRSVALGDGGPSDLLLQVRTVLRVSRREDAAVKRSGKI